MNNEYLGNVLIVEDDEITREILETTLSEAGFSVTTAYSIETLFHALEMKNYDALLLDLYLGDENALSVLPRVVQRCPRAKIVMMSAQGTIELAVSALEKGASTFVSKSKDPRAILKLLTERLQRPAPVSSSRFALADHGIIGESPAIMHLQEQIEQVSAFDSNVLILGESGTGKELVARAIHAASRRVDKQFQAINCGAIPANLMESELFGHKRGAFTDAKVDRKGIFQICEGGTLLFDEIGEMPLALQVKLLRVIQERQISPLGAGHSIPIDVRVIAATNRNPLTEVSAGTFREDLYYRLAVITIELPSLRDRKSDIPILVRHFLDKMNERFGKEIAPPTPDVEARLMACDWPGNIRELQNAIERGVILSRDGKLHIEDMFQSLDYKAVLPQHAAPDPTNGEPITSKPLSDAKQDFERQYLRQLLEMTRGNITEVARISERYRADVYRMMAKHGLGWEEFRAP